MGVSLMALQKTINLSNGLVASNAYIRIDTINGYKGRLDISVNSYISQADFQGGKGYLEQKFYHFAPSIEDSAPNFIKQGYEHLKTLDEFKDAIDLLDEGQTTQ
ncbi:hypothetical protein [Clostridium kluyveri]|uniref:Uncharacterized protein n=1 Tax=Clostridium kluyveri TaxID=1534 RepID=A0A1L5F8M9_CLOKL|nr:hypothetical protein [Clostridium kluyveri]APM39386.1 hypothetical protein BS101_11860 [Clostridium kluyveri]